jgi:hypothetical protein
VVVVQVVVGATEPPSMGTGTRGVLTPPPDEPVLPPVAGVPAEPVHTPTWLGLQVNPVPQSASALHGSCQGYVQREVVTSVHVGGSVGAVGQSAVLVESHFTATGPAPLHWVAVWLWQTMFAPQSAALVQGAGWQLEVAGGVGTVVQVRPPLLSTVQVEGDVATAGWVWQVRPLAQSASVAQVCARAPPGTMRGRPRATIPRTNLADTMVFSFASQVVAPISRNQHVSCQATRWQGKARSQGFIGNSWAGQSDF